MNKLIELVAQELAKQSGFAALGLDKKKIAENLSRPPKTDMGDLALGCFKLAKELNLKPNELAGKLAGAPASPSTGSGQAALVSAISAAGPYVNLRLNRGSAFQAALQAVESESQGEAPEQWRFGNSNEGNGKTLVVDLSSPNIAKPLAVHHLRSTMIGYSIKKIREAQGWRVVGVNHLGDWGTGFGKLIAGLKMDPIRGREIVERAGRSDTHALRGMSVRELNEAYRRFNEVELESPQLIDRARAEFAALEGYMEACARNVAATPEQTQNFWIWRGARELSLAEFRRVYRKLGSQGVRAGARSKEAQKIVRAERLRFKRWQLTPEKRRLLHDRLDRVNWSWCVYIGESFYVGVNDLCREVRQEAVSAGVAQLSDGALVIFTHGPKQPPLMIEKSDGATSYHARDLASAIYRQREFQADELAYVVGAEQRLHFEQLFRALGLLGRQWAEKCTHVDFGLLQFQQADGKWAKTSTRRGTAIMLEDLLDEAVKSVREIMAQKNPELAGSPDAERIASAVGVGAVVFNDLKNGRRNNVKFDWDAVLDFEGESGPYMQYQFVRMGSVRAKFEEACKAGTYGAAWKAAVPDLHGADAALLTLPEEWAILQLLADFPAAVARASREFEPSIVARALIDLASATSTWWSATKDTRIVGENPDLTLARVRLVNAIRKVLGRGLTLLGMSLVDRM